MYTITGLLPGGYVDEAGVVHRDIEIAPLTGREEELLAGNSGSDLAPLVTAILSRCAQRVGATDAVSEAMTRQLLVADRQYLLLKLREATFGEEVQATIACPGRTCANRMDIDFSIRDIPIIESEDKGPLYTVQLSPEAAFIGDGGEPWSEVAFRLPNGGDQEVISPFLVEDEVKASEMLLARCIRRIGRSENPGYEVVRQLSPVARMEIEQQMEMVAPQIELTMEGDCPECGREFAIPFDLHRFFFSELRTGRDLLYREVHYLAYHYHWSEREIMEMPRQKRRKYIEVLADEIERLNDAI